MELKGEQFVPQTQEKVWEALSDPDVLKACINGCESIEVISDHEYKVVIMAAVGPVKARFTGNLTRHDVVAPTSYSLTFQGNGGAAGFGKGEAAVTLAPEGNGTRLSYGCRVQVGGKLAQIGSRLIDGVGRKLAENFFTTFNNTVGDASLAGMPADDASHEVPLDASHEAPLDAQDRVQSHAPGSEEPRVRRPNPIVRMWWLWVAVVIVVGIVAVRAHG